MRRGYGVEVWHPVFSGLPVEIFFGLTPASADAVSPPRATARDPDKPLALPFEVVYLDPERKLPVLRKIAA